MKFNDKLWLWLSRKEPHRWTCYTSIFFSGLYTAFFLVLGAIALKLSLLLGVFIFLSTVFLVAWSIAFDYNRGYVDILHKRQVELWKVKRNKLEGK